MNLNTILKRNEELLSVDMDGETVMMDMTSGNYFGINTVGSHIWDLLEKAHPIQTIVDNVNEHFEIKAETQLHDDVFAFLSDMLEQKLIEEVDGN